MKLFNLNKMQALVLKKLVAILLVIMFSCVLYGKADNKITPGSYAYFHDFMQSFLTYIYTPIFNEKYAFINIDDATYEALGNPSFTPPEVLIRLVQLADKSNPKLLIIDVDLRASIENNPQLIDYLKNHKDFPILMTDVPSKATNRIAWRDNNQLDEIINDNPNLFWVSTLFTPQKDSIVRQSPYFSLFCDNNEIIIRPSVAVAVRFLNDLGVIKFGELLDSATITEGNSCDLINYNNSYIKYEVPGKKRSASLEIRNQSFDIQFAIIKDIHLVDDENNLIVVENSAKGLASDIDMSEISTESFAKRIMIIGGTNFVSKDSHETPVGTQSGAYLIFNAIESALNIHDPHMPNQPINYLTLLYFAIPLAIASALFRNSFLVIFSVLLLYSVPRIFVNTYTIELFTVLTVIFCLELLIGIYDLGKRIYSDIDKYGLYFFLSEKVREILHNIK